MNHSQYKSLLYFLILTLISLVFLTGCGRGYKEETAVVEDTKVSDSEEGYKDETIEELDVQDTLNKNNLKISVKYGMNGYIKQERYTRIHAKVENFGKDYKGVFQVILPGQGNHNIMYQEEVEVLSGQTKELELHLPMNIESPEFHYRFLDEDHMTVVEKDAKVKVLYGREVLFIGVLSKNQTGYRYLQKMNTKVFHLNKDDISDDYLGLNSLDVIVMDDFDITTLSKQQQGAIEQWVRDGGSLVLEAKEATVPWKDSAFYHLVENNQGTNGTYLTKYNLEFGNIQVAKQNLKLEYDNSKEIGTDIGKEIIFNKSNTKQLQITDQYTASIYNYRIFNTLQVVSDKEIPKVGRYIIVLVIYILMVGPVLYFILKKKEKRHFTWILVPLIAFLFTGIIYALGMNTRISKPYGRYLTYAKIGENGIIKEDTYLKITSPDNNVYEVSIRKPYEVATITDGSQYHSHHNMEAPDYDVYSTAITKEDNQTILSLQDYSAFTPVYFKTSNETTLEGSYEYNISDTMDEITGSFTNQLGYSLHKAAIYSNRVIIPMGDIKDGESVRVDELEKINISTPDSLYNSTAIDKVVGGTVKDGGPRVYRMHHALSSYIENSLVRTSYENYLIAFVEETKNSKMSDAMDIESVGMKLVIIPLTVNETNKQGDIIIPTLDPYLSDAQGYYLDPYRYLPEEKIEVTYTFNKEDNIKSIHYSERGNEEFDNSKKAGFQGTINFYNYKTKDYDLIFESEKKKSVTNLSSYLDENNTMRIQYNAKILNDRANYVPILSATKEAN